MKTAVAHLIPYMEAEKERVRLAAVAAGGVDGGAEVDSNAGVVIMATVKGDVHDIGKNIVGVVLGCNNYKVVDLGVMVTVEKILEAAVREKAHIVGLSGLITPSLDEMVHVAREMQRKGMTIPLLIGGATTSRMHTAVKIAPQYTQPVVHVLDASRSVVVVSSLLDEGNRADYISEVAELYEEMRQEHYDSLEDRKYLPLDKARAQRFRIDFVNEPPIRPPTFLGTRVLTYGVEALLPYIDWNPFFAVWQLRGKYPNRNYPRIFDDATVGSEAKRTYDDAVATLQQIARDHSLQVRAVVGLYAAESTEEDDIVLYDDEAREREVARLHTLRQQAQKDDDAPYYALSDFIAPKGPYRDYIGMFACSAGFGCDALVAAADAALDDYRSIMTKAVADRLAEACAEKVHEDIRRTLWGYSQDEELSTADLLSIKYKGIRPAPGYPSQPDHTEKRAMWDVMRVHEQSGIELTEHLAMNPAASVSALVFGSGRSSYFAVGKIGKDQVEAYAKRKGMAVEEIERWMSSTLNYDL